MNSLLRRRWHWARLVLSHSSHGTFLYAAGDAQKLFSLRMSADILLPASMHAFDQESPGFASAQRNVRSLATLGFAQQTVCVERTSDCTFSGAQGADDHASTQGRLGFTSVESSQNAKPSRRAHKLFMSAKSGWRQMSMRAFHISAAKQVEMQADWHSAEGAGAHFTPASSFLEPESLTEQQQRDLAIYGQLKEYVLRKHGDKPEFLKLLEEYNPLPEFKERFIEDFRRPDRELPPLDRVTIPLDTQEQYRVTRKTKWIIKQLRSPLMNDVPSLLEQWVKTMYPKRSDWLDLLKEFTNEKEQDLSFQVNVDKVDIGKVKDIPEIPSEERDIYPMLFRESQRFVRQTRSRTCTARITGAASTSATVGEASSSRSRPRKFSSRRGGCAQGTRGRADIVRRTTDDVGIAPPDWEEASAESASDDDVYEFALLEESFEVRSQDLTRIIVKYMNLERYDDVDRLMGTLDLKAFPPDFVVCTLLLDMNCKLKRLDKAREMYDRIRSLGYVPDVTACTQLIEFYCTSGNPEAGEMFLAEMESEKIHPTVDTYLAVLKGYGELGKASEAMRIFGCIKQDYFLRQHMGPSVYSALMSAYARANMLPSAVLTMEDMLLSGLEPEDKAISQLIAAFEKKNQFEKALDVLLKLESKAIRPGIDTLTTLIGWFGKLGLVEEAEILFKNVEEKVDTPDCKVYASLFSTYARTGSIEKARAILRSLEEKKIVVTAEAYEQMILSLLDGKQTEEAQSMRDRMISQGYTPSDGVERALLGITTESPLFGVSRPSEDSTDSPGLNTESVFAGVSKPSEEATESLGLNVESFLAGVSKRMEEESQSL